MPKNQPAPPPIDPRSDAILLTYTGGATSLGVPERDLHGGDLARIARVHALTGSNGEPVDVPPAALVALLDGLVASGSFVPAAGASEDQAPTERHEAGGGPPS